MDSGEDREDKEEGLEEEEMIEEVLEAETGKDREVEEVMVSQAEEVSEEDKFT